jgi:hypothetical protein
VGRFRDALRERHTLRGGRFDYDSPGVASVDDPDDELARLTDRQLVFETEAEMLVERAERDHQRRQEQHALREAAAEFESITTELRDRYGLTDDQIDLQLADMMANTDREQL